MRPAASPPARPRARGPRGRVHGPATPRGDHRLRRDDPGAARPAAGGGPATRRPGPRGDRPRPPDLARRGPAVGPSPARLRVVAGTVHSSSVRTVFLDTAASQATASALADDLGLATDVLHPVERVAAGEDHSPSCDRTSPPYGAASSATPSDRQGPASTEGTGAPGTRRVTPETGTPITRLRIPGRRRRTEATDVSPKAASGAVVGSEREFLNHPPRLRR